MGDPREKPSDQGQEPTTNSTHIMALGRNQTWATLVGGECSHHCATPVPLVSWMCCYLSKNLIAD